MRAASSHSLDRDVAVQPDLFFAPAVMKRTSRQLVFFAGGTPREWARHLRNACGVRMAHAADFAGPVDAPGESVLFERLCVVLLDADAEQLGALERASRGMALEPERCVAGSGLALERRRQKLADRKPAWGLAATGVLSSRYTGRGVRVGILDSGLDLGHPDFANRRIEARSFVAGLPVADRNGHGTFCAGVACGPLRPHGSPRYGVASAADLVIARVLNDRALGRDGDVIAGIEWAVRQGCAVACLSLGTPVQGGDAYSSVYERVAARALRAGTLLVAPAGNESQRPAVIAPVGHPANCPSIVSVGALQRSLAVAPFSNGAVNDHAVDVAGPGLAVLSAAPRPDLYQTGSGTSMATLYVAGIAALCAEAHPNKRGVALRRELTRACRALRLPPRDVGAGLVQAPR
jgi:subtilisin